MEEVEHFDDGSRQGWLLQMVPVCFLFCALFELLTVFVKRGSEALVCCPPRMNIRTMAS